MYTIVLPPTARAGRLGTVGMEVMTGVMDIDKKTGITDTESILVRGNQILLFA
jgi:hypothetical protein